MKLSRGIGVLARRARLAALTVAVTGFASAAERRSMVMPRRSGP